MKIPLEVEKKKNEKISSPILSRKNFSFLPFALSLEYSTKTGWNWKMK
jgi:hypothetical protein